MLSVHIVRFEESSGVVVFVSGAHAVADGTGFYAFINRWAAEAHALLTGEPAPAISVTFDRSVLVGDPADERAEMDTLTRFLYSTTSPIALALTSLPVAKRSYVLQAKMMEIELQGSLYRLPHEKLEHLRKEVQGFAPHDTRLSLNDALAALVSKTLAQAKMISPTEPLDQPGNPNDLKRFHLIGIACDIRHRLGISDLSFIGNAQFLALVSNPIENSTIATSPETLAEIAVKARASVDKVQPPQIRTCYDLYSENPEQLMRVAITRGMHGMQASVSNQSRFGLYDIDFGYGAADFATSRPTRLLGVVTVLPSRPPCKDLLVSITDTPAVMKNVRENEFWGTVAEFVW